MREEVKLEANALPSMRLLASLISKLEQAPFCSWYEANEVYS